MESDARACWFAAWRLRRKRDTITAVRLRLGFSGSIFGGKKCALHSRVREDREVAAVLKDELELDGVDPDQYRLLGSGIGRYRELTDSMVKMRCTQFKTKSTLEKW